MGIYKVQSNSSAPAGLQVGDRVVTGGGTYLITAVHADGTYDSQPIDYTQTTYNFTGTYDTPPPVTITPDSPPLQVTEENVKDVFSQKLGHTVQDIYTPVVTPQTQVETMSLEDAVRLAQQVMTPQYTETFRQTAVDAAQRLERAGLYDTLYGQALAAEAERSVASELNSAIYNLALELSQSSADQALDLLKLAVTENQYGSDYQASQNETALKYLYQIIQDLEERMAAEAASAAAQ